MKTQLLTLLTISSLSLTAFANQPSHLQCQNDASTAFAVIDSQMSYVSYKDAKSFLEFPAFIERKPEKCSQVEGQFCDRIQLPNDDVEIRTATDIGFSVKEKSSGAFLTFEQRPASVGDKSTGVVVEYRIRGYRYEIRLTDTSDLSTADKAAAFLGDYKKLEEAKVDVVVKCKLVDGMF